MKRLSACTKGFTSLLILFALCFGAFEFPLVEPTQDDFLGKWQNEYGDSLILFDDGKVIGSGPTVSSYSNDFINTDIRGRWFLEVNEFNRQKVIRISWTMSSKTIFLQVVVRGHTINLRFSEDEMEKDLSHKHK